MKPKEYVKKYKMDQGKFNHNAFIADFTIDFMSLIEFHHNANWNLTKFNNCVNDMRAKWNGISNRIASGLPEKLWNHFYATVVVKIREEYCGKELAARERAREEKKREYEERNAWRKFDWSSAFYDFFIEIFRETKIAVPLESFRVLGLEQDCSCDDIKKKYKELAFQHHPDRGGNEAMFRKIVEAKNRCLAFARG
jgi:hypothetical protein